MRWLHIVWVGLFFVGVVSCEKYEDEKYEKEKFEYWECGMKAYDECDDLRFEDPYIQSENLDVYMVKPLVVSADCNCIVEGVVKYVENGKTVAMVYYGDGECGESAKKVFCVDGNCDSKKVTVCYFYLSNCETPNQIQAE